MALVALVGVSLEVWVGFQVGWMGLGKKRSQGWSVQVWIDAEKNTKEKGADNWRLDDCVDEGHGN